VHGVDHTVGATVAKLDALRADTRRLLAAGVCSGTDVAHVVGRWTWAAMACRPVLSVFNAVYRFIECAKGRRFTLWRSAARELLLIMQLAPLMFVDTSVGWFDRVVATDASSDGMGVVAASLEQDEPPRVVTGADSAALVASSAWRTIVSSRWRRPEHINVLELRALTTAVRWVLSFRQAVNCRLLVLCDSQVVVGAVTKGRSSSQLLLRRLRYLAAMALASGLRLTVRWVASADNPADGPSRNF
jgi:ribonuclease HI